MLLRAIILLSLPLACAACANEPGPYRLGSPANAAPQVSVLDLGTAGEAAGRAGEDARSDARRKTITDKIMTAIALERVTGRKPDPGRLLVDAP